VTAIDRDQALQKLETLHDSLAKSHDMALWRDGVWQAILEVRAIAALPAIPLDDDTELSDIMEYLCEHFDASMDEHEVSRMSAMIREYASNVAKSRGALPVLETKKEES
jgi:hypothetical protein